MAETIQETLDGLRRSLTDYIEAAYHVSHPTMVLQRKRLLEIPEGIFQTPYLESTPRYEAKERYRDMLDLPDAAREAFIRLSDSSSGKPVIFDPPYTHQAKAVREVLANGKNLMIMTGTGSGKTESFLLPVLGKLAVEARNRPKAFRRHSAVRAIVLYPMNALVNDQLGRLRLLFGNPRVVEMFEEWAGRPARFARYTSRTPYAGMRSPTKDSHRLGSIDDFFVQIEEAAKRHREGRPRVPHEDKKAHELMEILSRKGKWPAKHSVSEWFGEPGTNWRGRNGQYQRAVLGPHDAELLTRHEVQESPPDLLITNYSMLEYMMMRPIERPIFDKTREWLREYPNERILVILDEAHLYRGTQGAEVGLLLRRLRERLGIGPERFQVICATASFSEEGRPKAGVFGAQLCGVPQETFVPIEGDLATRSPEGPGTNPDAEVLASIDLEKFFNGDDGEQAECVQEFLRYRGQEAKGSVAASLFEALNGFAPFNKLVNDTMVAAIPLDELGSRIFPGSPAGTADRAITALLALGGRAKRAEGEPSLLPCRVHSFFRGLPGLWVCMDSECSELPDELRGGPAGKMYSQPRERCGCGAPVLEYFTCRYCGTSYARGYTNDVANPRFLWREPGRNLVTDAGQFEAFQPLDLLLEEPSDSERGLPAMFDLRSGMINPNEIGDRYRTVYLRPQTVTTSTDDEAEGSARPGEFVPCGCCNRRFRWGGSSVQNHQTKGDQPFQALLTTQIKVQPPGRPPSEFAPLRGRKVLVFSDSRQMAARLAPTLQNYSLKDAVRALLPAGYQILARDPQFGPSLNLNHAFLAVIVAAHKFGVRVRPQLEDGESMPRIDGVPLGQAPTGAALFQLLAAPCPVDLMAAIVDVLRNENLGLEPLAIASIAEVSRKRPFITSLPDLPGLAEDPEAKLEVARAWLRCWLYQPGIWFDTTMPPSWWTTEVTTHRGEFKAMDRILVSKAAKRVFQREWLGRLNAAFVSRLPDGGQRLPAANLSLSVGGEWRQCTTCRSVHRPIRALTTCIDCGAETVLPLAPHADVVFRARHGFYRDPVIDALREENPSIMSLIAAEHTAQLNAAQSDDAFSKAEAHELRFQDIDLAWRDTDLREPAIDVLSSTTTMEVGIDIGELSGVALRNMPPGRANYQQRAGRAGRRGNAVATVVAFGSADSHDDHYFVAPDEMIRGPVTDPRLTLENPEIARRHLCAYLLQRYHEDRLPGIDPEADPSLFSVLGRVRDFRDGTGVLNRADFAHWLEENREELEVSADRWLPTELSENDRRALIENLSRDALDAIDRAIGFVPDQATSPENQATASDETVDADAEPEEESELADPSVDKLLDRLLYWGVLPRYAFPTDVATFYVFNRALSTPFRHKMEFAPAQSLSIALSQYAPNKQIWIGGKQYTSKAIYSPYRNERGDAWRKRKLYYECFRCGHAKTDDYIEEHRKAVLTCEACQTPEAFGPAMPWFRPPGFAHPIDRDPVVTADDPNEIAYATRAKLIMPTPGPDAKQWVSIGQRVRGFPTRRNLLVSNSGPQGEGYLYCVTCGRIEAVADPEINLRQPHTRPYPNDETEPCSGQYTVAGVVLGTDFVTDIALFSLPLDAPFRLRPGNDETATALRTVCEALAKAACARLQLEPSEIMAEYRPALTDAGANGLEVEVFLYDTLAGGAGFSPQLVEHGAELFRDAIEILRECPAGCDASCYRCLRSFRNRLEHRLLDRHLGEQLLRHALEGGYPDYPASRIKTSLDLVLDDLQRQFSSAFTFERDAARDVDGRRLTIPIVAKRLSSGEESWITLASPIAPEVPVQPDLRDVADRGAASIICVDDLLVRNHLPQGIESLHRKLR